MDTPAGDAGRVGCKKKTVKSQEIGMGGGRGFRVAGGTCVVMTSIHYSVAFNIRELFNTCKICGMHCSADIHYDADI